MEEPPQSWELGPEDSSSQDFSGPRCSRLRIRSAQTLPMVLRPPLPTAPSSLLAPISSSSWLPSEAPAHLLGLPPSSPTVPSFCPGDGGQKEAQLVRLTWPWKSLLMSYVVSLWSTCIFSLSTGELIELFLRIQNKVLRL